MSKTLFLWDVARTLFVEEWNSELTGYPDYPSYVVGIGKDPNNPRVFEESYQETYLKGEMFNLALMPGYAEVLGACAHNEIFTTGVKEQMEWRAQYLNPKVGFDIRKFFQKINTSFDFAPTNVKTQEMLTEYLRQKVADGYGTVVYTDDKLANGEFFRAAAEEIKKEYPSFSYRFYHILNDNGGIRPKGWYQAIGGLRDVITSEKQLGG